MYSPIEQFTIINIIKVSNITINIGILVIIILIIIKYLEENKRIISKNIIRKYLEWQIKNHINIKDHIFIIFLIIIFILFYNLLGLIPFSFTITAQFILIFSISIIIFISLNLLGFFLHKFFLFFLFLPSGVPLILIPIITILEIILYITRVISLTLRLCANMIAGHILIKLILNFLLLNSPISFFSFFLNSLFSFILIPFLFLEILVAIIQTYIFLTLILSYYQDISFPH